MMTGCKAAPVPSRSSKSIEAKNDTIDSGNATKAMSCHTCGYRKLVERHWSARKVKLLDLESYTSTDSGDFSFSRMQAALSYRPPWQGSNRVEVAWYVRAHSRDLSIGS
jgi:hypothetical protein